MTITPLRPPLSRAVARRGFSLVEVALALGICSFCLVAVMGLLPVGINTNRDTLEQTAAAAVAREVVADFWGLSSTAVAAKTVTQTPRYGLPLPTVTTATPSSQTAYTLWIAEDGTKAADAVHARYRVDIFYGARSSVVQPAPLRVLVTYPATANPMAGTPPTNMSGAFQTVTVLNTF